MKTNDAPTKHCKSPRRQGCLRSQAAALAATLLSIVCLIIFCANTVSSQTLRRRIQRRIERKATRPADNRNKLTTTNGGKEQPIPSDEGAGQPEAERAPVQPSGLRSLFAREELSLWIPGFGNRAALLMIFRQLNLTPEQKNRIRDLRREVGDRLRSSRQELNQLEAQLGEAIYGSDAASLDTYDPAKVKELTEQVIQKWNEWFRLQTDIESQFRQILTPDQFYVYRELALQMAPLGNRPLANPTIRRQQRRLGVQPNPQSRPD
jgi:Spy/CpxP family protein refolding chaperone